MILDGALIFTGGTTYGAGTLAIGQALTTTAVSTNIIDLGGPALPISSSSNPTSLPFRDIGIGDDPAMKLLVQCLTTFSSGTSLTVQFQGAVDNGSGSPGSFTTYYSSPAILTATLVAGARLMDMDVPRPPAGVAEPRFLQINWSISGTMATATIFAAIVLDRFDQVYQSTNNAVSGGYYAGITVAN